MPDVNLSYSQMLWLYGELQAKAEGGRFAEPHAIAQEIQRKLLDALPEDDETTE